VSNDTQKIRPDDEVIALAEYFLQGTPMDDLIQMDGFGKTRSDYVADFAATIQRAVDGWLNDHED